MWESRALCSKKQISAHMHPYIIHYKTWATHPPTQLLLWSYNAILTPAIVLHLCCVAETSCSDHRKPPTDGWEPKSALGGWLPVVNKSCWPLYTFYGHREINSHISEKCAIRWPIKLSVSVGHVNTVNLYGISQTNETWQDISSLRHSCINVPHRYKNKQDYLSHSSLNHCITSLPMHRFCLHGSFLLFIRINLSSFGHSPGKFCNSRQVFMKKMYLKFQHHSFVPHSD